jgi:hypothetical protein
MYCVKITLIPTAALTFRMLPGSILNIATYPFVPPTSLSGYLRRLGIMHNRLDLPNTKINKNNPFTYLLPSNYVVLGAYPSLDTLIGVHRTYRKGMREFTHDDFSKLYTEENKANFQLHTWEYLITERLTGYVVAESEQALENIQNLEGYGCFIGKEGYAFLQDVSPPVKLIPQTLSAYPSTIVPIDNLLLRNQVVGGCDIYNLYRYHWLPEAVHQSEHDGFWGLQPTPVDGFIPFVAAYFSELGGAPPNLDVLTDDEEIFIPISLIHTLRGEFHA